MEDDFQALNPQKVRRVQIKPKVKPKGKHKEPKQKLLNQSESQDSDVQQWSKHQIGFHKNKSTWANDASGLEWILGQKLLHQTQIIDKAKHTPSKNQKIQYIEYSRNPTPQSSGLFQDPAFPKTQVSLTGQWGIMKKYQSVVWQRASKKVPEFPIFSQKVAPTSIIQGKLGDCYFLSSLAALAERPDRIFGSFLTQQHNPQRRFEVKVLLRGRWQAVELDEYIPFVADKPVFSRSTQKDLWVMLLQKAWAKLYGSYMNIASGHAEQCLHDFTGAPLAFFKLKHKDTDKEALWKYLLKASKREYAMCASSNVGSDTKMSETGIVQGHCYTVLNATYLTCNGQKIRLIQMRNPWGRKEGKGNWSDRDPRWKQVSAKEKERICFNPNDNDGIFYVEFEDLFTEYRSIVVAEINDNASYVYETLKDPNCNGVVFRVDISERTRYSFQIDKTPKRLFSVKQRSQYSYPTAFCKIFSAQENMKQVHNFHDRQRLTSRKYTLQKGIYYVYVLIQFDSKFEKEYEVTLAVYAQHSCGISIASAQQRNKLGLIKQELPASKQAKKKRYKSSPKPSEAEFQDIKLSKPNIKFVYNNGQRPIANMPTFPAQATNAPINPVQPYVNVQIKNKKTGITIVSSNVPKNIQEKQISQQLPFPFSLPQILVSQQSWVKQIVKMENTLTIKSYQIDQSTLSKKQLIYLEPSPAQNYLQQLRKENKDFIDDRFPPKLTSLTGEWGLIDQWKNVRWQRISKILPQARIFGNRITPDSIKQGFLGDCYFLAGLAALAQKPERILNLFLLHERNQLNYYSLKMLFRGKWLTIDIDDYIPYLYDMPAFSNAAQGQLWVVLLEKAWAKIYSNYKRIQAGFPQQTLHDLTGAPIRHIYLKKSTFNPQADWNYLMKASTQQYAMVASSQVGSDALKSVSGIVQGHAYTLLQVAQVSFKGTKQRLVQLRNPWGKGEGVSAWADSDQNWDLIDQSEKRRIGYSKQQDGSFFLGYQLFCKQFKIITIAQINDNASYVYLSCKDNQKQGCFFQVKIAQKGRYSFQVDNSPERIFEDHYHSDYQYPSTSFQMGLITGKGYVKRLVSLVENARTLFHSDNFEPGTYICYVRTDFNPKFQKDFQINLAVYGDYPCIIALSSTEQAILLTNNPNTKWPRLESNPPKEQWNSLRSYKPDKIKKKF